MPLAQSPESEGPLPLCHCSAMVTHHSSSKNHKCVTDSLVRMLPIRALTDASDSACRLPIHHYIHLHAAKSWTTCLYHLLLVYAGTYMKNS